MDSDRSFAIKPAARRSLDLAFRAEGKRLLREVASLFAADKPSHKSIGGLIKEGVWNKVLQLFLKAGTRFGALASENAQVLCGAPAPAKDEVGLRARIEITAVREHIEDRVYAQYRLAGGSHRGQRGGGCNARQYFEREFGVAESEAVEAAVARIYLPDPNHTGYETVRNTAVTGNQPFRSKPVREGETVAILYAQLKKVRSMYRTKGWTASQIRDRTRENLSVLWEWVDRIPASERRIFMNVFDWDDYDEFIFRQIASLYRYAPHLRQKQRSWRTVRDWRKRYKGWLRHGTFDGLPKRYC
jgi:hypothetical protein